MLLCILVSSCSNVFYQPSKQFLVNPVHLGLEYEEKFFESKDGTQLHSWFFPAQSPQNERGTVVQFHGNAENLTSHFMSLSWLVREGYNLFIFDYRGYGKSDGSPSQAKIHLDAISALEEAIKLSRNRSLDLEKRKSGNAKNLKLIAYGQSLGGTVLLRAISDFKLKNEFDVLIIESAFLSYRKMASEKLALTWMTWPFQWLAYLLVSDRYAPQKTLGGISPIPLLVIHGDRDRIVPFHHGEKIYRQASPPKWFWPIRGGKHINAMSIHHGRYREKLLQFLEEI